jgi:DNA-binding response OmpR family regulator
MTGRKKNMNAPNETLKVLVVEDDGYLSRACRETLVSEGFLVEVAKNGIEALGKVRVFRPDIVLLDLVMPAKSGFEVLTEMKMDKDTRDIPVIVFTNLGQESDIKKAKLLGAVDYLVKIDVSMKELLEKVQEHLAEEMIKAKKGKID